MSKSGIIYIMTTNVDGVIKIGQTDDLNKRFKQLRDGYKRGIWIEEIYFAIKTDDYEYKEKMIHKVLDRYRLNNNVELFSFDKNLAKELLTAFSGEIIYSNNDQLKNINSAIKDNSNYIANRQDFWQLLENKFASIPNIDNISHKKKIAVKNYFTGRGFYFKNGCWISIDYNNTTKQIYISVGSRDLNNFYKIKNYEKYKLQIEQELNTTLEWDSVFPGNDPTKSKRIIYTINNVDLINNNSQIINQIVAMVLKMYNVFEKYT